MTYREVIIAAFERSGLTVTAFAEKSRVTQPHLSKILSGSQQGTLSTMLKCLDAANIELFDCLTFPSDPTASKEDTRALNQMRDGIARGGTHRDFVLDMADVLRKNIARDKSRRTSKKAVNEGGTDTALK